MELKYRDITLDYDGCMLKNNLKDKYLIITNLERKVLKTLIVSTLNNKVVSANEIEEIVGICKNSNGVPVYMTFLRKKFKCLGIKTKIKVIRNAGYRLEGKDYGNR